MTVTYDARTDTLTVVLKEGVRVAKVMRTSQA